jgi:hypothetical protein
MLWRLGWGFAVPADIGDGWFPSICGSQTKRFALKPKKTKLEAMYYYGTLTIRLDSRHETCLSAAISRVCCIAGGSVVW